MKHESLNLLLADYQILYQKLRNFHWNVRGPLFFQVHEKFEAMYLDAALKIDSIAERIATIGGRPASTFREYLDLARLKEDQSMPGAQDMVRRVLQDLEQLGGTLREVLASDEFDDDSGTYNMLEGFADEQEKEAWMLRSFLEA